MRVNLLISAFNQSHNFNNTTWISRHPWILNWLFNNCNEQLNVKEPLNLLLISNDSITFLFFCNVHVHVHLCICANMRNSFKHWYSLRRTLWNSEYSNWFSNEYYCRIYLVSFWPVFCFEYNFIYILLQWMREISQWRYFTISFARISVTICCYNCCCNGENLKARAEKNIKFAAR